MNAGIQPDKAGELNHGAGKGNPIPAGVLSSWVLPAFVIRSAEVIDDVISGRMQGEGITGRSHHRELSVDNARLP